MIRVLLVDDHALFRSSLRVLLDREDGITTIGEAGTAEQAIAKTRALQPDVVLLDLVLPRKDGYAAMPELLKASASAKILVVSSQTQPTSVRQAIGAGARGFVPKRSSDKELVAAIRRVAAGEQYVEPNLGARLVVDDSSPELMALSERERDVLPLLALGYTNQEVGKRLYVSVRTVDSHRATIMRKLRLETRAELVLFALANGLIGAA
ncbi:MAG: two-component system, NarL family, response regulator NreC [Pseudonocardiales bacterium]|jgi:DNA-binding NarL/FixJ family response regulator|nr:two-component system, NarL family, response regulator NreC [Pseudonocardiales bacterium]